MTFLRLLIQIVLDEVINIELSKVSQWLAANKLSLNVAKIKFMVFHMHKKTVTYPDLYLNGIKIERVAQFSYFRFNSTGKLVIE